MNLVLRRVSFTEHGIFGMLFDDKGNILAQTLEHAYPADGGGFAPKVPPGAYICTRGMHRLEHMTEDFETFEIAQVPGHTNILFHTGNTNADSAGCVLLGSYTSGVALGASKVAFAKFMVFTAGQPSFSLLIKPDVG